MAIATVGYRPKPYVLGRFGVGHSDAVFGCRLSVLNSTAEVSEKDLLTEILFPIDVEGETMGPQ